MTVQRSLSTVFKSLQKALDYPIPLLSSGAFDPASISGLRSRLLDANTFTSPIDSKYYLKDSSTTNTHLPRQGRCWLFDGSNDYGVLPAATDSVWGAGSFTFSSWIKGNGTAQQAIFSINNSISACVWLLASNAIMCGNGAGTRTTASNANTANTWTHLTLVYDTSLTGFDRWVLYVNGVSVSLTNAGVFTAPVAATANSGLVGARNIGSTFFPGSMQDIRIYSVAKNITEITAIYESVSGTFDTTGLIAAYPCNEESGTTGYDISGNGNHLTLTNITQATFHAADTGVTANPNNAEGYRLSGSVYIPKRLTDSLAADGNALTVTGRAAYHGCAETPCVTNHTGTVYIAAAHLTGSETVVSFSGSTTTPTISAGRIDWQSGQTLSDLTLSDGTRYTMQEGPGSGNTNRTVYNVNGSTNHGTLTNGTVATIWGSRLAGTAQDWCILYGGRIGAAGEFVPGRVSGSLAADGSAKTLAAGKFGNPFSRLNLNPATAAELNGRSVPTSAAAGADINATVTPSETAFRRTASDGDDRILIYDATLSGADLSNVEGYLV